MLDVLRFWLERGVDGFRIDALWHLVKDEHFADNPLNPAWREGMDPYLALVPQHTTDRDEVHAIVARMRRLLDEYPERVLIGEIYLPLERLSPTTARICRARTCRSTSSSSRRPDARHLAGLIDEYESLLPQGAWPNWVLGNHDRPRVASRVGRRKRVAAMLLHAARHADALLRRRNRHDERRHPARACARSAGAQRAGDGTRARPGANADAVERGAERRLRRRRAVAAARRRLAQRQRRRAARGRTRCSRSTAASSRCGVASRRSRSGATGPPCRRRRARLPAPARGHEPSFLVALNLGSKPQRLAQAGSTVVLSTHLDRANERTRGVLELRPDEGLIVKPAHGD